MLHTVQNCSIMLHIAEMTGVGYVYFTDWTKLVDLLFLKVSLGFKSPPFFLHQRCQLLFHIPSVLNQVSVRRRTAP